VCLSSIVHAADGCLSTNIGPGTAKIIPPAKTKPNILPENTRRWYICCSATSKKAKRTLQGEQLPTQKILTLRWRGARWRALGALFFWSETIEISPPILGDGAISRTTDHTSTPRLPPPRPRAPRRGHRGRACGPTGARTPEQSYRGTEERGRAKGREREREREQTFPVRISTGSGVNCLECPAKIQTGRKKRCPLPFVCLAGT